jgi:hypothetical protein
MSPLGIEIMLHYHVSVGQYGSDKDGGHCPSNAPAVRDMLLFLAKEEMLGYIKDGQGYEITGRGRAYVDFLQDVPFPITKWVMP